MAIQHKLQLNKNNKITVKATIYASLYLPNTVTSFIYTVPELKLNTESLF